MSGISVKSVLFPQKFVDVLESILRELLAKNNHGADSSDHDEVLQATKDTADLKALTQALLDLDDAAKKSLKTITLQGVHTGNDHGGSLRITRGDFAVTLTKNGSEYEPISLRDRSGRRYPSTQEPTKLHR